jgi:acyl-CoA synthetase (AMP-forming)/AMP-acid ligase II
MSIDAAPLGSLRDRWYREGWFTDRTWLDAFADGAADHGPVPVTFVAGDESVSPTVAEIRTGALILAAALQGLGIRTGDAVAVQLTNRPECAIAYEAVLLCGAVLVPIVHIYGVAEVGFILAESGTKALIIPDRWRSTVYSERVQQLSGIATLNDIVVLDAEPGAGYLAWSELSHPAGDYRRPRVHADDVCVLIYTSGTTSAPKGVQHSHNSLLAEQATVPDVIAGRPGDVQLMSFPPGHIAGVSAMLRPLISGARAVFLDSWDPARAADLVHRFGVTSTSGTPFHLAGLLEVADTAGTLATLREFMIGAATVTEEQGRLAAAAGITTYRCYGLTEHPTVTCARPEDPAPLRLGTDGLPLRGSSVRIVGPDGADRPAGGDGEVVVQGPDQFVGYPGAQRRGVHVRRLAADR